MRMKNKNFQIGLLFTPTLCYNRKQYRKKDSTMKKYLSSIIFFCTALFAVGFALLRCTLMRNYNFGSGFYSDDALHAILRFGLILLAAIFFACGYIYNKKEGNRAKNLPQNLATTVMSYVAGAALCGFALYTLAKFVIFRSLLLADVPLCILALIGSFYYFTERQYANGGADFRALLCSANALALLVMIFGLYFNKNVSYVNHSIMLAFAAAIFLMLAIVAEANFSLGRPAYRRFFSYAPTAVVLSFSLAIPDLVTAFTDGKAVITDIFYDILILALGLHQLARLSALAFSTEKTED